MELHLLEPTLADQTGHCHGYVQSLIEANRAQDLALHVWLDRRGRHLYSGLPIHSHGYFSRRLRQWQKLWCLRSLIKSQQNIFIPTAGRTDLVYLNWLLKGKKYSGKIFLHFHQFKATSKKMALLKRIAAAHPQFIIMTPTEGLSVIFKESGFLNCEWVPCPGYAPRSHPDNKNPQFGKIIFAGAARSDKGFPEVVRFVEYMTQRLPSVRFEIQISPPHSGRYDKASESALSRLKNVTHPNLVLHERTLGRGAYQALFTNAICLLTYDPDSYRHKFSGVALDAFYAGCPVISVVNTWTGETTKRFEAGIALTHRSPENMFIALQTIRKNYAHYQKNAKHASTILQQEHSPQNTLRTIKKYLDQTNE